MSHSESASRDADTATPEEIASEIREFRESIDDPDNWRILVPVDIFDEVEDRLETEEDLGTSYRGITLCYDPRGDRTQVEYGNALSDHLEGE